MSQTWGGPYTGVTVAQAMTNIYNSDLATVSNHIGASEPATMFAGQFWWDTTNDYLKIRNEANSAWVELLVPTKSATLQAQCTNHGTIAASSTVFVGVMPSDCTIVSVGFAHTGSTTSSTDANDLGFMLTNSTAAVDLFSAEPTTFNSVGGVGGGSEIAADTLEVFTPDQNATVSSGDTIELDLRFNASFSASLTRSVCVLNYTIRP